MPDWLREALQTEQGFSLEMLVGRLLVSFGFGCVVALVYYRTRRPLSGDFLTTLVMLTILIAMVTLVIGNSVARAFGLVGALSIVRFRTVVEDTRDTAFVILAVAVGMAAGAGYFLVPLIGLPIATAAALLFGPVTRSAIWILRVRVGLGHDPQKIAGKTIEKYMDRVRLEGVSTARQGTAIEGTYRVRIRQGVDPAAAVVELNSLEGVQEVELGPPERL